MKIGFIDWIVLDLRQSFIHNISSSSNSLPCQLFSFFLSIQFLKIECVFVTTAYRNGFQKKINSDQIVECVLKIVENKSNLNFIKGHLIQQIS